jgi:hypothetical protein
VYARSLSTRPEARVSYWTEPSEVMKSKGADSGSKTGQHRGETWQPWAKLGLNWGIFYENGGIFCRKSLTGNVLTKTRMDDEFILNPHKDVRRKTTGGRRVCFRNTLR